MLGQSQDNSQYCRCQNDVYHIHIKEESCAEGGCHDHHVYRGLGFHHAHSQVAHHVQNHRRHAGLHALEHQRHIGVGGKRCIEERDHRQNGQRRQDGADYRHNHSQEAPYPPAYQNSGIDGNGSRRRLGQGRQVQHLLIINPMQAVHKFPFHKRDDDKASAKSKCADVEHTEKQLRQCMSVRFSLHA